MEPGVQCVPATLSHLKEYEKEVLIWGEGCCRGLWGCQWWLLDEEPHPSPADTCFLSDLTEIGTLFQRRGKYAFLKNKCFIGLFFLLSFSITHTHMHTHTSGSQMPNISFWSFYWWKKADISWKPIKLCDSNSTAFSITVFGLHIFLHSLFILVIFLLPLPLLEWEKNSSLR